MMTPSVMTVPDDTLRVTKKAHGNPQAFYFILIPKGHHVSVINRRLSSPQVSSQRVVSSASLSSPQV
jgi:hypothetical protein